MSDAETRSLVRAAVLLLIVSLVRLGWSARGDAARVPDAGVLEDVTARSETLREDQATRTRALAAGERLDPNRAEARELDRLPGIGPATAEAIVMERESGGSFRGIRDLERVRGVGGATARRIEPYLDFGRPGPPRASSRREQTPAPSMGKVDVNRAESAALQGLPGVGPVLAARIVAARGEAPFRTVDDLTRVPGIGAATLDRLRDHITVGR